MATKTNYSVSYGSVSGRYNLSSSLSVSGSRINWNASIQFVDGTDADWVEVDVYDTGESGASAHYVYNGHGETTGANGSFSGSWAATKTSGTVQFYFNFYRKDDYNFEEKATVILTDTYSGATIYEAPSCNISLQTESIYAGSTVSLRCTVSGSPTTGTVKRYYKAAGASSWSNTTIQSGVTRTGTISDTIPSSYNGGQVYWRFDISDGTSSDYAVTSTKSVVSNSAPSTPSTLTIPETIAAGAAFAISWSASTDPDGNLAGYILERSITGGSVWTQVYKGAALTTTDTLVAGTTRVRYRVKAYDTYDAESGYKYAPTSGDITVTNNQAPTTPASPITVTPSALTVGVQAVISWGESTDPDGDAFNYVLERSVDGLTNYQAIYTGTNQSYTDEIGSWSTVTYRVKAVDVHGASSGYRTADTKTVSANSAPTLSVKYNGSEIADGTAMGSLSAVFSLVYTVNDADSSDTLTVKEIVDGVTKRTRSGATRGTEYTMNFRTGSAASTSYWNKILNGSHTVTIEVSDGLVTVRRSVTFTKVSSGLCVITLPAAIPTDQYPAVVALSISGYIPAATLADADKFIVEVTADGTNWERCDIFRDSSATVHGRRRGTTGNVNAELYGGHYLFLHKITNAGQVFNFRISAGGVSGEVTHIDSVHWAFLEEATAAAVASATFNGVGAAV